MTNEQLKIIIFSNKHCLKYRIKALIKLNKKNIIEDIKNAERAKGYNSMGVSEGYYDPDYLIKTFFEQEHKKIEELEKLSEKELILLIDFAEYVTEVFY